MRDLKRKGWDMARIGRKFGVSRERVRQITLLSWDEEYTLLKKFGMDNTYIKSLLGEKKDIVFRKYFTAIDESSLTSYKKDEIFSRITERYRTWDNFEDKCQGRERTREIVRARDNWTCQNRECGRFQVVGTRRFDIHHLGGLCGKLSRSYDPINTIKNLITLCHRCHLNLPEVRNKMIFAASKQNGI